MTDGPPVGTPRFTHINEPFICENCGNEVPPRASGCRNHCPRCLASKHVDLNPGDRANACLGLLEAIDYELDAKKGIILIFKCRRCHAQTRNMAAHTDPLAPDDYDAILRLKNRDWKK